MSLVGGVDIVGVDEGFAPLVILFEDAVELAARIGDDECARMRLEIVVQHPVQPVEYAGTKLAQILGIYIILARQSGAGGFVHKGGILAQRIVNILEDDKRVGVEGFEPFHDDGDVVARHSRDTVDDVILPLRRFQDHVVHAQVLKKVVAEYGDVDDVRLADVKEQTASLVVIDVGVFENGSEILGEMPGNGMVVIFVIIPSADDVGVGVLMPETEGRRAEYALRNGVAEIDYLGLLHLSFIVAGGEHGDAAHQHDGHEQ